MHTEVPADSMTDAHASPTPGSPADAGHGTPTDAHGSGTPTDAGHGSGHDAHGAGYDEHAPAILEPFDPVMWSMGVVGVAMGLLVALCTAFATGML